MSGDLGNALEIVLGEVMGGGGRSSSPYYNDGWQEDMYVDAPPRWMDADSPQGGSYEVYDSHPPSWETADGNNQDNDVGGHYGGGGGNSCDPDYVLGSGPLEEGEFWPAAINCHFDSKLPLSTVEVGDYGVSYQSPSDPNANGWETYVSVYGTMPPHRPAPTPAPSAPIEAQPTTPPAPQPPSLPEHTPHTPDVWGDEITNPTGSKGEWAGEGDNKTKAYQEITTTTIDIDGEPTVVTTTTDYNSDGQIIGTHSSYERGSFYDANGSQIPIMVRYDQTSPDQPWNESRNYNPPEAPSEIPVIENSTGSSGSGSAHHFPQQHGQVIDHVDDGSFDGQVQTGGGSNQDIFDFNGAEAPTVKEPQPTDNASGHSETSFIPQHEEILTVSTDFFL